MRIWEYRRYLSLLKHMFKVEGYRVKMVSPTNAQVVCTKCLGLHELEANVFHFSKINKEVMYFIAVCESKKIVYLHRNISIKGEECADTTD